MHPSIYPFSLFLYIYIIFGADVCIRRSIAGKRIRFERAITTGIDVNAAAINVSFVKLARQRMFAFY